MAVPLILKGILAQTAVLLSKDVFKKCTFIAKKWKYYALLSLVLRLYSHSTSACNAVMPPGVY